jgi:hypothetical protein
VGKSRKVPPAQFRICVASPGRSKECLFLCEKGLNVPAKFREILSVLPLPQQPAALVRFFALNKQCD